MRAGRAEARQRVETWLAAEAARPGKAWLRGMGIARTWEHPLGWLVFLDSRDYLRTRDLRHQTSGPGPFLVDAADRTLYQVDLVAFVSGIWNAEYLYQVKGLPRPDPVLGAVHAALVAGGPVAALREVRRLVQDLTLAQARAYVDAVAAHREPPALPASAGPRPHRELFTVCLPATAQPPVTPDDTAWLPQPGAPMPVPPAGPDLLPQFGDRPGADDEDLVRFLRAGTCLVAAASLDHCRLCADGRPLGSWVLLTDGVWTWPAGLAHYVELHHLRLPSDFVAHARAQGWAPARPSIRRLRELEQEFAPEL